MLKIPELPIYNTERYTNFSPISPDDIRPGDIYTNDSLFLYVSHFSFNKTAGYSVWDKEGEYVGTEMYSSQNIYAIVTYLNNNNFRPLDYDLEVVDPYNTDRRLLLTPNGIKKVNNVNESRKRLNENFNSNELRNWFKLHGGVMKTFEKDGYPNMNVKQDALSDVNDNDILYLEEFPSYNEAVRKMNKVKKSDSYGRRSDYDMKCYFTIYRANDGMCLLVGIDRNNIETGVTWGGEVSKKGSDRHWRDVNNLRHNYGTNKYTDDSDTYYYSQKGNDFGLKTNHQFKGKAKDNANIRNRMSDDEWNKYQKDRVNDMDSYLRKYYGKGLKENISRVVKTVLKESFEEQWEEEIQIFLNGLKNGEALIDGGYVAVEWGHNESDPRFIYYKEGEDRLTDDHFSMQHSRRLYFDEIKEIQNLAKQVYGVDIYIPDDEYYDELEDWEK